ncbi:MAG: site-specific DNA-methyltransferase, partial [Polyangiaceae bacterium]|nr:site-specific DNA-methyltransferase [Polyangiaceae bacterium]
MLRLAWSGRVWEPGVDSRVEPARRFTVDELVGSADAGRVVLGDALDVAHALCAEGLGGQASVVYLDPPFASQAVYRYEARLDGPADGRVLRAHAYDDRWASDDRQGIASYLDMLAPRLDALVRLLARGGTIWVHVDYRASYLVRVLLDELLGRDAFVNEIVWRRAPNLGRQAASYQFGRTLDTLVVYGVGRPALVPPTRLEPVDPRIIRKDEQGRPFIAAPRGDYTDDSIERLDREGRVHRTASGKVYVKYFLVLGPEGAWCRERRVDTLWTDVKPLRHARPGERTGFPTQKPLSLLQRIIACASPPGGLVVDLFAGSGTTAEAAHALGRRFVIGDASPLAIAAARARLLRAGIAPAVAMCGDARVPARAAARVVATREGDGSRVELVEPAEPLAWAIDV